MKKAFTWIELMVVIAIVVLLVILLGPAIKRAITRLDNLKPRIEEEGRRGHNQIAAKEGDFVYFYTTPSTTITGMVNTIRRVGIGFPPSADVLFQGTNGQPQKIEAINVDILHKVPNSAENWK